MFYLLDANVLIDANRDYYPIGRVDEYWEWLIYQGEQGYVKIPLEIYEELKKGNDRLAVWAKNSETEKALKLPEEVLIHLVQRAIKEGYAKDLSDIEIETIGWDPFLIAYALVDPSGRCIVTTEVSKPSKKRQNRHVPDVCKQFGILSVNTYELTRRLDFKTKWKVERK